MNRKRFVEKLRYQIYKITLVQMESLYIVLKVFQYIDI